MFGRSRMTPQQRMKVAQDLFKRSKHQEGLTPEQREEARRTAMNLIALNGIEARRKDSWDMESSNKPRIRCPHCEEHLEAQRLLTQRRYRNQFGLDVFECPDCHQEFKFEPAEFIVVRDGIEKGEIPTGVAIEGAKTSELLPSEKLAVERDPRSGSKRIVPLLTGVVALLAAGWLVIGFDGWWRYVVTVPLLAFGWISLKTTLFAAVDELRELTGDSPMSEETKRRLKNRL